MTALKNVIGKTALTFVVLLLFSCKSAEFIPDEPVLIPAAPVAEVPAEIIQSIPAPLPQKIVKGISWNFEDPMRGTQGWYLDHREFSEYRGQAILSRDESTFGMGLLRLDLDFRTSRFTEWSEPVMKNSFPKPVDIEGVTQFSFDCYYNPSLYSNGNLAAKVSSIKGIELEMIYDSINAAALQCENAGRGFLKAEVTIPAGFTVEGTMEELCFSIVGMFTDYRGPVFLGNLRWE